MSGVTSDQGQTAVARKLMMFAYGLVWGGRGLHEEEAEGN